MQLNPGQCSPFITLYLGSIGMDSVIRWFCGGVVSALDYKVGNLGSIPGSGGTID